MLGVTAEYESVRNHSVESGAFISHGHVLNNSMVAVLGSTVAEELFGLRETPSARGFGSTLSRSDRQALPVLQKGFLLEGSSP